MSYSCTVFAAPLSISAQAAGPYSINVAWNPTEEDTADVIHYEIQWSLFVADKAFNSINTRSVKIPPAGNASSVLIGNLLPSMEYSFQVRVIGTAGFGQWSHQVRARTDPAGMCLHLACYCSLLQCGSSMTITPKFVLYICTPYLV